MIQLTPIPPGSLDPDFKAHLKAELEQLAHDQLPLQRGLQQSSVVSEEDPFTAVILRVDEGESAIEIKATLFYSGIIGGCNCADDPTPPNTLQESCEVRFVIDRASGGTHVELL